MNCHRRPTKWLRSWLPSNTVGITAEHIADDLDELFRRRATARGVVYASVRYAVDVLSVWLYARRAPSPARPSRRARWVIDMARDAAYAKRVFVAHPGGPLITVLGLGLAVGVGTSVFAILNAVALRPLGVPNPNAMKCVMQTSERGMSTNWSFADAVALRERSTRVPLDLWMDIGGVEFGMRAASEHPARIVVRFVGAAYFDVLGGSPAFGRTLAPADDAARAAVAVVSYRFWMQNLGGDPGAIGRTFWLNTAPVTVVGIMPRTFLDTVDRPPALWVPVGTRQIVSPGAASLDRTNFTDASVALVARVPSNMTDAQAQASVSTLASAVAADLHGIDAPRSAGARLAPLDSRFSGPEAAKVLTAIVSVLTTIGLLLLLACTNITNLLLASAAARQREIGMRLALGATRERVIRQLLTESVLLGLTGGALGLVAAMWGLPVLMTAIHVPGDLDVRFDTHVYVFLTVVSTLAGVGAGLAPARYGTGGDLASPLKGGTQSGGALSPRRWLIGAQATASVVLLILASLLTRAATSAAQIDLGFNAERLVTMAPSFGNHGYDADRVAAFWDIALPHVRALPGIDSATLASYAPLGNGAMVARLDKHARAGRGLAGSNTIGRSGPYTVFFNEVGDDYFSTLGVRIIRGRAFTADEVRRHASVVIISEAVAQEFWAGEDPLGRPFDRIVEESAPSRIVGIAANVVTMQLRDRDGAAVYQPLSAKSLPGAMLVARTSGRAESMIEPLRTAIRALDPGLHPTAGLVSDNLERQLNEPRTLATLAGSVGVLALALALIGIYGVAACMVSQRAPEIGLRMAMGATVRDVLRLLIGDTLRPVAIGLGLGVIVAIFVARVMSAALFGVHAYDPLALMASTGLLAAAALLAAYVPARRAARVDPVSVLRS